MQLRNILLLAFLIALVAGCDSSGDETAAKAGPEAWLPLKLGTVPLEVQIVLTQAEQRKGLMHRDSLPENSGMLFPYASPRRLSFWMANTRIPLDIGFFDGDGLLLEIHHLLPFDTASTQSHGDDMQYALEMNDGWFARNGLYPGQKLDLGMLADALRRRGADPRVFGLDPSGD